MNCVRELFRRKYDYESSEYPKFSDLIRQADLDAQVHCTGYGVTKDMEKDLMKVCSRYILNMIFIKHLRTQ